VHVAVGAGPLASPQVTEDKTTTDSVSTFFFHPFGATEAELRLVRAGTVFTMYARAIGAPGWALLGTHDRPFLPATLQVGLMAYDFNVAPDLTLSFDAIAFE
jgi:hypothetical protein